MSWKNSEDYLDIMEFSRKFAVIFIINIMEARIKIQKWGNDLGISIPPVFVNELSLFEGLYVDVHDNGNRIIIEPNKKNRSYKLTDMLNKITENNIHQSVDTGIPTGNEIW